MSLHVGPVVLMHLLVPQQYILVLMHELHSEREARVRAEESAAAQKPHSAAAHNRRKTMACGKGMGREVKKSERGAWRARDEQLVLCVSRNSGHAENRDAPWRRRRGDVRNKRL